MTYRKKILGGNSYKNIINLKKVTDFVFWAPIISIKNLIIYICYTLDHNFMVLLCHRPFGGHVIFY